MNELEDMDIMDDEDMMDLYRKALKRRRGEKEEAKRRGEEEVRRKEQIIRKYLEEKIEPLDARIKVRGIGMIWGIDLAGIDPKLAINTIHEAFSRGLICEVAGRKDSVVKIMPPLTIDDKTLLEGLDILTASIIHQLH